MTFIPGEASKSWKLRFPEGAKHSFKYRYTYFLTDNMRYRTDWVETAEITTEALPLIIPGPFVKTMVIPVRSLLDPARIIEASVDVIYSDAARGYERRERVTFGPDADDQSSRREIRIPMLDAASGRVTYSVSVVRTDGSVLEMPPTDAVSGQQIFVRDGVGETRIIRIELANTDLDAAGLAAVRVRVRGKGEDPDQEDVLFRPGDNTPKTVTLVKPAGEAFAYSYEVEGYTTLGLPKAGIRLESDVSELVVGLP